VKLLLVGDPHATPEELDDCNALMDFVETTALREHVDEVCLMGDQHHTHAIIRAEVMAFYRTRFKDWAAAKSWNTVALVGNHDYAGEGQLVHSMMIYDDIIHVVETPMLVDGRLYMPYYADREQFVLDAQNCGGKTLICHQTFAGSMYENGFYAQDGVNPDVFPQEAIISGHIHTPQWFGKVCYIGAPRWRSRDDANIDRNIWLYEFAADGAVVGRQGFSTNPVCRQIRSVLDTPDMPFDGVLDPSVDWRIDIQGPADFVERRKARFQIPGVKVRTFKTDKVVVRVKESEGIGNAFRTYLSNYTPKAGTPRDLLSKMAQERLHV
jgi:DNA repair exonuclease SbcCD nuclease subunit